jgi:tetratricopeptide (TPR) repeat protein
MNTNNPSDYNPQLQDIIFISINSEMETSNKEFIVDPTIPVPVQLQDGKDSLDIDNGVTIAMIASGLIKVIAHQEEHEHISYYKDLLFALQPDIVQELQLGAVSKAKVGELDFAIELSLAAVHLNDQIPELFVNLATLYAQHAKHAQDKEDNEQFDFYTKKQLEILRRGLTVHPLSHILLSEYGIVQLFHSNDEIALEYLTKYLEVAPKSDKREIIEKQVTQLQQQADSEKTLQEAFDEMQLGNDQTALTLITTFLESNENNWSGHFIKGWAMRRLGEYQGATEAFLKALSLGAQNADIYNELSICALETGERELSKDYLDIALELEEDNLTLLSNLALLLLQDEEYNRVADLILRAKEIDPNDPLIEQLSIQLKNQSGIDVSQEDIIDG